MRCRQNSLYAAFYQFSESVETKRSLFRRIFLHEFWRETKWSAGLTRKSLWSDARQRFDNPIHPCCNEGIPNTSRALQAPAPSPVRTCNPFSARSSLAVSWKCPKLAFPCGNRVQGGGWRPGFVLLCTCGVLMVGFRPERRVLARRGSIPISNNPMEVVEFQHRKSKYSKRIPKRKPTPQPTRKHMSQHRRRLASEEGKGYSGHAGGYTPDQRILLVGEGDLSFGAALCKIFRIPQEKEGDTCENIVATSFDSQEIASRLYPTLCTNAREITACGGEVEFDVDATNLKEFFGPRTPKGCNRRIRPGDRTETAQDKEWRFDRVIFNFPKANRRFNKKINEDRSIEFLLRAFFPSALSVIKPYGEIHVSVPHSITNIVSLAVNATGGRLKYVASNEFDPRRFPGYIFRSGAPIPSSHPEAATEHMYLTKHPVTYRFTRNFTVTSIKDPYHSLSEAPGLPLRKSLYQPKSSLIPATAGDSTKNTGIQAGEGAKRG
ncbi:hypothetical protein AAMO2058_000731600, partial [Amorphochlora amoebiformis]